MSTPSDAAKGHMWLTVCWSHILVYHLHRNVCKNCCSVNVVRSAVYMMNKTGPRTEHCGTPQMSWTDDDPCMSQRTYCERLWRCDWNKLVHDSSRCPHKILWSTVSKAADKQQRLHYLLPPRDQIRDGERLFLSNCLAKSWTEEMAEDPRAVSTLWSDVWQIAQEAWTLTARLKIGRYDWTMNIHNIKPSLLDK